MINCFSTPSLIWYFAVYFYMGVLEIIGLVLAIKTRKVKIKVLNDSREISAIIYAISVMSVELVVVSFLLQDYSSIQDLLYLGGVLILTTVSLGLLFLPKVSSSLIIHTYTHTRKYCYNWKANTGMC